MMQRVNNLPSLLQFSSCMGSKHGLLSMTIGEKHGVIARSINNSSISDLTEEKTCDRGGNNSENRGENEIVLHSNAYPIKVDVKHDVMEIVSWDKRLSNGDPDKAHSNGDPAYNLARRRSRDNEALLQLINYESSNPNIATIERHKDQVFALAVADDLLYTASESKDIRAFKAPGFAEVDCFGSGNGVVQSLVAFGETVYSAHQDNKIRLWRRFIKRGDCTDNYFCRHKLVAVLPTLGHCVRSMIMKKNYVQIRRHKRKLWIQHADTISALALGHRAILYSASWDKTVKVWNLANYKCMESFQAHDDAINALIFAYKDGVLVTSSADGTIKLWASARKNHSLLTTLRGHKAAVNALAFSAHEKILYSGSSDCSTIVWKKTTNPSKKEEGGSSYNLFTMKKVLLGHTRAVLSVSTFGNRVVCSGSADKTIRVWKRTKGSEYHCLGVLEGHSGPVKAIASVTAANADDGTLLIYSGSLDSKVKVWAIGRRRWEGATA